MIIFNSTQILKLDHILILFTKLLVSLVNKFYYKMKHRFWMSQTNHNVYECVIWWLIIIL